MAAGRPPLDLKHQIKNQFSNQHDPVQSSAKLLCLQKQEMSFKDKFKFVNQGNKGNPEAQGEDSKADQEKSIQSQKEKHEKHDDTMLDKMLLENQDDISKEKKKLSKLFMALDKDDP